MAASAIDLTTAAVVAGDLGVASDATVDRLVTAASQIIASYCGRKFEKATVTEYPASYGRPKLLLERAPVVGITSITELGSVVDAGDYECLGRNAQAGIIYRKNGVWALTARVGGRVTETLDEHEGESGDNGITVVYEAGYVTPGQKALDATLTVTLPEDVQEAAVMTAVQLYRSRGLDRNIASESLGDWSVSYAGTNAVIGRGGPIPEVAQALLAPYTRRVF